MPTVDSSGTIQGDNAETANPWVQAAMAGASAVSKALTQPKTEPTGVTIAPRQGQAIPTGQAPSAWGDRDTSRNVAAQQKWTGE